MIYLRKYIRKRVFIKKTKVFNFINKVYHISEEIGRLSRKNFKRVKTKASTVGKMLLTGMLMREKSINQIMEKIHKRNKYKKIYRKRRKDTKNTWIQRRNKKFNSGRFKTDKYKDSKEIERKQNIQTRKHRWISCSRNRRSRNIWEL